MLHTCFRRISIASRRVKVLLTAVCLLFGILAMPLAAGLQAAANAGGTTLTAYKMGNYTAGQSIYTSVAVESGKTYTFTVLWRSVTGEGTNFSLYGDAIGSTKALIVANTPQEGASFDVRNGTLRYTFTAQGSTFEMGAALGENSWGEEQEIYFACPALYESDAAGNKTGTEIDCNADFDPLWSHYMGGNQQTLQVAGDFFENECAESLLSLDVGYPLSPAFDYTTYFYTVTVPYTADSLDIQYVLGADGVSASITGNEDFREGETKNVVIVVTNKSGTITHYTLSVTKERNPANTILAMHMSEWSDAGLDNSVTVQAGKTYTFTVQWKYVQGTEPVFFLDGTALDGRKILVRADTVQPEVSYVEEGDKLSYTFTAKGDRLQMSALMGGEGNTHLRDIYFANPTLYESDENGNPVAGGDAVDCDPDFDEAWIKWSYGGDYRKVVEVDKDFFHRVFPNALTSLDVGYTLSDPFDYRRNYYEITVPYHVDQLQIAYTLADGASLSGITGNGGFVEGASTDVVIAVNNDAGGVSAYTIRVYREREPAASLTSLDVGYALTPPFDPQILAYTLSVPNEVEQLDVHYTTAANTTFISLEGNTGLRVGVPQDVTITVANTKGYEQTYTITVTREGAQGDTSPMENALGSVLATLTCTNATTREDLDKALKDGLA